MQEPLPPALRTLFDRVATHFPGHTMQRVRYPDGRMRYTYASPGMREIFGLDPEAIVSQASVTHDWVHIEDRQRFLDALDRSARALSTLDEEVRVIGHGGGEKWVRSIGYPRKLKDGVIVWDGIAIDVTDRREAAAMLERALQLAKHTEEAQARLIGAGGNGLRQQLSDIKTMADELAMRTGEPTAAAIVAAMQQALVAALLKIDTQGEIVAVPEDNGIDGAAEPGFDVEARLSQRQRDVLRLVATGLSNRAIAGRLGLTEGTVKLHVAATLKRLGVRNRVAAVIAARQGL